MVYNNTIKSTSEYKTNIFHTVLYFEESKPVKIYALCKLT